MKCTKWKWFWCGFHFVILVDLDFLDFYPLLRRCWKYCITLPRNDQIMTSSMKSRIKVLYSNWRGRRYSHNNRKCVYKETLFIVVDGGSFYVIVVANGEWVEEVARRLFVMQMCFVLFSNFVWTGARISKIFIPYKTSYLA